LADAIGKRFLSVGNPSGRGREIPDKTHDYGAVRDSRIRIWQPTRRPEKTRMLRDFGARALAH